MCEAKERPNPDVGAVVEGTFVRGYAVPSYGIARQTREGNVCFSIYGSVA